MTKTHTSTIDLSPQTRPGPIHGRLILESGQARMVVDYGGEEFVIEVVCNPAEVDRAGVASLAGVAESLGFSVDCAEGEWTADSVWTIPLYFSEWDEPGLTADDRERIYQERMTSGLDGPASEERGEHRDFSNCRE